MTIRFLSKIKEWESFSNLSPTPIEIDGEEWKSVEHYYQYMKFKDTDINFALKLKNLDSPKEVKKLSLTNENYSKDWDLVKIEIIKKAVIKKFETILKYELYYYLLGMKNLLRQILMITFGVKVNMVLDKI